MLLEQNKAKEIAALLKSIKSETKLFGDDVDRCNVVIGKTITVTKPYVSLEVEGHGSPSVFSPQDPEAFFAALSSIPGVQAIEYNGEKMCVNVIGADGSSISAPINKDPVSIRFAFDCTLMGIIEDAKELKQSLEHALAHASDDGICSNINAVLFAEKDGRITLTATDSYRLLYEYPVKGSYTTEYIEPKLLNRDGLILLKKYLGKTRGEIKLFAEDGGVLFYGVTRRGVRFYLHCLRADGEFPLYRRLLPKADRRYVVENPAALARRIKDGAKQIGVTRRNVHQATAELRFTPESLYVVLLHEEEEGPRVEFEHPGWGDDEHTFLFNPTFIADALAPYANEIELGIEEGKEYPILVGGYGLLMPKVRR